MDSAEFLASELLNEAGFRHAFFTRRGGVSKGPYESLNFSVGVGDAAENVRENLRRAAAVLAVQPDRLLFLSQVHGSVAQTVGKAQSQVDTLNLEGDAILSAAEVTDLAVGVRIADCVPILIGDRKSGRVAAVHSGWRGTVQNVVKSAVEALCEGAAEPDARSALVAAIGPHISLAAFEVAPDTALLLAQAAPGVSVVSHELGFKPHVDLRKIVRYQLAALGIPEAQIDDVPGCTVSQPELFFSFRRDGKVGGRHLAAIVPRPNGRL